MEEAIANVLANQRPGWPLLYVDQPSTYKIAKRCMYSLSVKFHQNMFSSCRGEIENVSAMYDQGAILVESLVHKSQKFVEDG